MSDNTCAKCGAIAAINCSIDDCPYRPEPPIEQTVEGEDRRKVMFREAQAFINAHYPNNAPSTAVDLMTDFALVILDLKNQSFDRKVADATAALTAQVAAYREERDRLELELAMAGQHLTYLWKQTRYCPCGARAGSEDTHPHVSGCPTEAALDKADALKETK
jgi:hypothetical protein